jgi:hypothetical protein
MLTDQAAQQVAGYRAEIDALSEQQEMVGEQAAGVLGAQSAQAGKVGLAGGGGSFMEMQKQVKAEAKRDVDALTRQKSQIQSEIKTTESMRDMQIRQSELGDTGLQAKKDQSPFLAALGGGISGAVSGLSFLEGGSLTEKVGTLGEAVDEGIVGLGKIATDVGEGLGEWWDRGVAKYGQGPRGRAARENNYGI